MRLTVDLVALLFGLTYPFALEGCARLVPSQAMTSDHRDVVASVEAGPGTLHGVRLCTFDDDSVTLVVRDEQREILRQHECSAYGIADAKAVKDARGKVYILFTYGEGRGTNATTNYLAVFGLSQPFVEYVRTPLSSGASANARWTYSYIVETPPTGGLRLVLTLGVDGPDAIWVPIEKQRAIAVDTQRASR